MISWKSDPYLWWVFSTLVCGQGSPTKLVQHSPALQGLFASHVSALETCPVRNSRIKKMKYAKQRFNSTAVPLQRCVLFFEAVWRFCIDVQATRAGTDPAKSASNFLATFTSEALIQAAMMSEAADEHIMLRRFFDTDRWDATSMSSEIQTFLNNLDHLFIPKPGQNAGCLSHGFVKYAVDVLSTPHVCWVAGKQRVIGGPGVVGEALISKCLSRMANFIRLTVSAVSAEFPQWQLVRALDVLSLARHCGKQRAVQQAPAEQKTQFERLSKAFDLDPGLLEEEFNTCLHAAKLTYEREGTGESTSAWIVAVNQLHNKSKLRLQSSPLVRVLHIAQCWVGLSTSKVEQTFGKIKSAVGSDHRHCSPVNECMEARLCSDLRDAPDEFKQQVFKEAGAFWVALFSGQRASGKDRVGNFTRGKKRKQVDDGTEAGFLRKRRAAVSAAAPGGRSSTDIYGAAVSAGAATWGAQHQDREDKWQKKRETSKYTGEHILVPADGIQADKQRQAITARAKAHAAGERAQAKMRSQKKVFKPKVLRLSGMPVHFGDSLTVAQRVSCQTVVVQHRMERCDDCLQAVYFVTSNPGSPEDDTKLVTGLCGGMLATPEWFCSEGRQGLVLKAIPAITVARRLWISDRFRTEQPRLLRLIDRALATPGCRWKACSKGAFVTAAAKTKPPLDTIALVTTREKERLQVRTAFDLASFLDFIFRLDQAGSSMGTA